MDPLNHFLYPFQPYDQIAPNYNPYNIKPELFNQSAGFNLQNGEPPQYNNQMYLLQTQNNSKVTEVPVIENTTPKTVNTVGKKEDEDSKDHLKHLLPQKRRNGPKKGRTSSYWVKKIDDKTFPFYGCAICNVSFVESKELDDHVKIHEGRLTSYDIRLHNQKVRKEKRKEQKKLKKLIKAGVVKEEDVKKELKKKEKVENFVDIDIKPEDGYIGNEKASEYSENTTEVAPEQPQVEKKIVHTKYGETTDPRLHKLFKCHACKKQFSLCYYLRLHVRAHTDDRPYVCSECGTSFITAGHLGRHTKRMHLAIRFQCRICFKAFVSFENLTRHFDKKHADQKLEGEPYDYNAILPYLKELEEQSMREKEAKPKEQDIWVDAKPEIEDKKIKTSETPDRKDEDDKKYILNLEPKVDLQESDHVIFGDNPYVYKQEETDQQTVPEFQNIDIDAVAPPSVVKVEVEINSKDYVDENIDDYEGDSANDNPSDEDYFPENTWVDEPKLKTEPLPETKPKAVKKAAPKDLTFCDICQKNFTTAYYKIHQRRHTGEKPFKCVICGRGFISAAKMQNHVITHKDWQEKIKVFENEKHIKKEDQENDPKTKEGEELLVEQEKGEGEVKGKRKTKKGKKKKTKIIVRREKGVKRDFRCLFCYKTFMYEHAFEVHKTIHKDAETPLPCYYCLAAYPTEDTQRAHEQIAHSDSPKFLCIDCEKKFFKKEALIAHRKNIHKDDTLKSKKPSNNKLGRPKSQYMCDICSKACYTMKSLQKHIVSHGAQKYTLRYECPVCAHMFHTRYHVQMHLVTHQKEGLILEENRANILAMVLQNARKIPLKSEDTALNVSDLIPPDERSRVCNICGEIFQHFYYLEEHLKTHGSKIAVEDSSKEEERKHICKICNKGFKLPYYLKLHNFTHVKDRPFSCQQCGKGFITKGKLKRHLETHSGLKKYQCHICYKFFTRPAYLRIHVRTIHGTQDYNFGVLCVNKTGDDEIL